METECGGPVTSVTTADEGARRSTRRRMVQSTLFQRKSTDQELDCSPSGENGRKRGDIDDDAHEGDEDESPVRSRTKQRRRKNRKSILPSNESLNDLSVDLPESKTPKKANPAICDRESITSSLAEGGNLTYDTPNLMLEAKMTAEELARIFTGKKIHPFFTTACDLNGEKERKSIDIDGDHKKNKDGEQVGRTKLKKKGKKRKPTPSLKECRKNLGGNSPSRRTFKKNIQDICNRQSNALDLDNGSKLMTHHVPNLMLEAKMIAEENSRFSGKKIHPFFTPDYNQNDDKERKSRDINGDAIEDGNGELEGRIRSKKMRGKKRKSTTPSKASENDLSCNSPSTRLETNSSAVSKAQSNANEDDDGEPEGVRRSKRRGKIKKSYPPLRDSRKDLRCDSPATRTLNKSAPICNRQNNVLGSTDGEKLAMPLITNLMLEAKLTAEDYSRRFSGKKIHPFFTSAKAPKRNQNAANLQDCYLYRDFDKCDTIGPVHVFEKDEDNEIVIDWKNWKFEERSFENVHTSKVVDIQTRFLETCSHAVVVGETSNQNNDIVEVEVLNGYSTEPLSVEQSGNLQERFISCDNAIVNQSEKKLWSDKYQPRKAADVCGNCESVNYLNEWLQSWRSDIHQSSLFHPVKSDEIGVDSDDNNFECGLEDNIDDLGRKNVLLITGPVGSGKTAAIYACAKQQGFKILEISASDLRSGSVIKQKFGEALESQFLESSQEESIEFERDKSDTFGKIANTSMCAASNDNGMEMHHSVIDEEMKLVRDGNYNKSIHGKLKPLILFEDVDIVFPEDRGFTLAIKEIADKAKGPVILTRNSGRQSLPDNFERSEIFFSLPSEKELLNKLHEVCYAESAQIDNSLVEHIVHESKGDLRKAIMQLQFWCQGNQFRKAEGRIFKVPFNCNPESAHKLMPLMMPWNFPSLLSEHVDDEVTACLSWLKDIPCFSGSSYQRMTKRNKNFSVNDSLEAKKNAMLVLSCPEIEYNDFLCPNTAISGCFDSLDIPYTSTQKLRRSRYMVMLDSDDENSCEKNMFNYDDCNNTHHCEAISENSLKDDAEYSMDPSTNCHIRENVATQIYDDGRLNEVSCVAESTFVPETEMNDATEPSPSKMCSDEVNNDSQGDSGLCKYDLNSLPSKFDPNEVKGNESLPGNTLDLLEASLEEVEDSQCVRMESSGRENQLLDQCSRMDFSIKLKQDKRSKLCSSSSVHQIWKKLYHSSGSLKALAALEQNDVSTIVRLGSHFSNFISDADLLLSSSHLLDSLRMGTAPEGSEASSHSDDHLLAMLTFWQRGFCYFANEIASARSKLFPDDELKSKFVASEHNDFAESAVHLIDTEEISNALSKTQTNLSSERKAAAYGIMECVIPQRAHMTLRTDAFHEYLSSLACISRVELSRSEAATRRRRARHPTNYLSAMMSQEDITLLRQCSIYGDR